MTVSSEIPNRRRFVSNSRSPKHRQHPTPQKMVKMVANHNLWLSPPWAPDVSSTSREVRTSSRRSVFVAWAFRAASPAVSRSRSKEQIKGQVLVESQRDVDSSSEIGRRGIVSFRPCQPAGGGLPATGKAQGVPCQRSRCSLCRQGVSARMGHDRISATSLPPVVHTEHTGCCCLVCACRAWAPSVGVTTTPYPW